jgi:hypothetical protein
MERPRSRRAAALGEPWRYRRRWRAVARRLLERAHAEARKASHEGWPGEGRITSDGATTGRGPAGSEQDAISPSKTAVGIKRKVV